MTSPIQQAGSGTATLLRESPSPTSPHAHSAALLTAATAGRLVEHTAHASFLATRAIAGATAPSTGPSPADLGRAVSGVDLDRPLGTVEAALDEAAQLYLPDAVYFHHPRYAAHLNCPVVLPAVAAEALVSSINSSMDTWDQSAGATLIEQRLVDWAAGLVGWDLSADGIFTSGGTQSNLQALMLARNHAVAGTEGPLPERLAGLRIYASQDSHFSVATSAYLLGLGKEAVVSVPVDRLHRMDPGALREAIDAGRAAGHRPMAIVATAGTTDFGAIDPLGPIADIAAASGAWLHVDAAYGCGLLASELHRERLAGIERADSMTADFHKSFFQPIGSSVLLLRDGSRFAYGTHHAEYLNPRGEAGTVPNLVDKSLQTTRRFDALKLWVTLRSLGAPAIGAMFDSVLGLAVEAGRQVAATPELRLAAEVQLSTVVFRYEPEGSMDPAAVDRLNDSIRHSLYTSGEAMVAATTVDGRRHLKLTLLNPETTGADVAAILAAVVRHGGALAGTAL